MWCKATEEIPLNSIMWKPSPMLMMKYRAWYYANVIFLHLIPGLLIDGLIKLSGNEPLYVHIHCISYVLFLYIEDDAVSPSCRDHIFLNEVTR